MSISLEAVTKRIGGETHLHEMSLALSSGSFNTLLGPTQAGKTSMLRIMAGLDRPTSGRVLVDGRDVTGASLRSRSVAMVYQQFVNYPSLTVYENIASPLRVAKLPKDEIDSRVRKAASRVRIEAFLNRLPQELSGGQQQRTAIARAIVKEADLLLLDEPLVNLDYKLREELRAELRELFQGGKTTVVYATTEPQEALMMGGMTAIIDAGRVLQYGSPVDVYRRPLSTRVAEVMSDPPINLIQAELSETVCRISADAVFPASGQLASLPAGRYTLGLRANHVAIGAAAAGRVSMPAQVELSELSGSETYVHLRHGEITFTARLSGIQELALGATVNVNFAPERLLVFDAGGQLIAAPEAGGGRKAA